MVANVKKGKKNSRLVSAGLKSNLLSQKPAKALSSAKWYSEKTKVDSPSSRGI